MEHELPKIQTDLDALLITHFGNQTAVSLTLQCNRATVAKHIKTNGLIVLEDGRVFRDTGRKML